MSSLYPVILNEVKDLPRSAAPDRSPTHEQAFVPPRGEILRVAQNDNGGRSEPAEGSRATRGPSAAVGTTGVAVGTTKCPADPDVYLTVLTDNLDQVAEAAGDILGPAQLALVDRSMRRYLTAERELLDARFETWLGEGHGDLRCEHICLEPDAMQIYDCVEFEIAIRCADVASDLAFLLMDLRRLGAQEVAAELLERYRAAGFDLPQPVVDLYAAHRALVRAKVAALERSGRDADRDRVFAFEAASYLDLATAFATPIAPMLVLVSGLSGSGKSTVAAAIARATGGTVFASDRVRKELAGLAATTSAAAEWHQGIYAADWTERTYDRLLALATAELKRKRTAVVDATFLDNDQRERFAAAARERGIPVAIVWTELDDEVARQRLERRARERNDPSDASMQIREHQQKLLRDIPLRIPEGALAATVDTGVDGPASLDPLLTVLDAAGSIGALLPDRTMSRA
ncbi:MAG: AAA family ATPase [Thermomicrobiales bacterium]|nr:AAA family ATPase [Thermomicrobiales bacterium]